MSNTQMVINYVPGEECRVAVVEDGKLEELHTERFASASRVGNIYLGRVSNVEASIQAAFIDFGVEENGFLHISDLHPRYFPGEDIEETTERVGHKTPRRERPPIQHCLRRGQEVVVQVLKEGVGTKGPSLTSYLSIPGRFLVMMPQMDRVGVSRKVEDEEARLKMREILDQLDLPEGFGFILRTAGMDRTKTELKRDLAYLQRLWKDMDRRLQTGSKARLLYSESDLLVRCLRDVLTAETDEIIIDNEMALKRASRFLKIVAPRTQTKLLQFPGKTPIFHAFGIEQQIALINAREVPLPSGGRLVIDQTEALVAIDVNSGKSRDARDAEDNAYRTNVEAVDETCRQLRLRDLGGIVINDLIDMRHASHRKDIEARFRERLKRDRARSTVTTISEFGILEMTRQRMRGSHEQVHFHDCPSCRGRGLIQRPESVASDALRDLAAVLDIDRIHKIELVVPPRVAGELLSTKRQLLSRIERHSGKKVDVRVSETLPADRVTFYGYDAQGADVDLTNLPKPKRPRDLRVWEEPEAAKTAAEEGWSITDQEMQTPAEPEPVSETAEEDVHPIEIDEPHDPGLDAEDDRLPARGGESGTGDQRGGRRRGRRGRGRGRGGRDEAAPRAVQSAGQQRDAEPRDRQHAENRHPEVQRPAEPHDGERSHAEAPGGPPAEGVDGPMENGIGPDGEPRRRRRRRRRRGRGGRGGQGDGATGAIESGGEHGASDGDRRGADDRTDGYDDGPRTGDGDHQRPAMRNAGPAGGEAADDRGGYSTPVGSREPLDRSDAPEPGNEADGYRGERSVRGEHDDRGGFSDGHGPHDGRHERAHDGPHDGPHEGPDGQQGGQPGGEPGEGGRRRRRRRRGRGGRGGGGGGGGTGAGGHMEGTHAHDNTDRGQPVDNRPRESARGGHPEHHDRGHGQRGGGGGGGGSRGGGGDRGGGGGRGGRGGPRDGRGGGGGPPRDGRGGGQSRGGGQHSPVRASGGPAPSQPPAPQPPSAPQPKLLYSFRRKLSASELNRRPKPE